MERDWHDKSCTWTRGIPGTEKANPNCSCGYQERTEARVKAVSERVLGPHEILIISDLKAAKADFVSAIDTIVHDIIHQTVGFDINDAHNAAVVVRQALKDVWEASA
jgi:hypothetical protein